MRIKRTCMLSAMKVKPIIMVILMDVKTILIIKTMKDCWRFR